MNETIQNILTRRSVRKFKPDMITDEELELIVEAGVCAPSTKGRQARHIIVIKGQEKIARVDALVKSATISATEPYQQRYLARVTKPAYTIHMGAPVFVITTAQIAEEANPEADCAVILENMFLAARSLGIGSVWINQLITISDVPQFREFLTEMNVPSDYRICGAAAFGYPDTPAEPFVQVEQKKNIVTYY